MIDLYCHAVIDLPDGSKVLEGRLDGPDGPLWRTSVIRQMNGHHVVTSSMKVYRLCSAEQEGDDASVVSHFVNPPVLPHISTSGGTLNGAAPSSHSYFVNTPVHRLTSQQGRGSPADLPTSLRHRRSASTPRSPLAPVAHESLSNYQQSILQVSPGLRRLYQDKCSSYLAHKKAAAKDYEEIALLATAINNTAEEPTAIQGDTGDGSSVRNQRKSVEMWLDAQPELPSTDHTIRDEPLVQDDSPFKVPKSPWTGKQTPQIHHSVPKRRKRSIEFDHIAVNQGASNGCLNSQRDHISDMSNDENSLPSMPSDSPDRVRQQQLLDELRKLGRKSKNAMTALDDVPILAEAADAQPVGHKKGVQQDALPMISEPQHQLKQSKKTTKSNKKSPPAHVLYLKDRQVSGRQSAHGYHTRTKERSRAQSPCPSEAQSDICCDLVLTRPQSSKTHSNHMSNGGNGTAAAKQVNPPSVSTVASGLQPDPLTNVSYSSTSKAGTTSTSRKSKSSKPTKQQTSPLKPSYRDSDVTDTDEDPDYTCHVNRRRSKFGRRSSRGKTSVHAREAQTNRSPSKKSTKTVAKHTNSGQRPPTFEDIEARDSQAVNDASLDIESSWNLAELERFRNALVTVDSHKYETYVEFWRAVAKRVRSKTWQECSSRFEAEMDYKSKASRKSRVHRASSNNAADRPDGDEDQYGDGDEMGPVKLAGKKTLKRKEQLYDLVDEINKGHSPTVFDSQTPITHKSKNYRVPEVDMTPLNIPALKSHRRQLEDDYDEQLSREQQKRVRKATHQMLKSAKMQGVWPVQRSAKEDEVHKPRPVTSPHTHEISHLLAQNDHSDENYDDEDDDGGYNELERSKASKRRRPVYYDDVSE